MYVIWSLEVGGAERVVLQQAAGVDRRKFKAIVVCLNQSGHLAHLLRDEGIPVIALNKRPGFDVSLPFRLAKIMRAHHVDIVHSHLWGASLWARLGRILAGPRIVIIQEHGMGNWRGQLHFLVDRMLAAVTHRVLFVSHEVRRTYIERSGTNQRKCTIIPNGIVIDEIKETKEEIRDSLGWKPHELIILSVGRLSPEKGHIDLVDAFALIGDRLSCAKLIIVGEGSERAKLLERIARVGLQDRIVLAGLQDNVPIWMKAADIYVQPSRREALPLAILEAMASNLPVLATAVGEISEIVEHGVNGFLAPPNNPKELSNVLYSVCTDEESLVELSRRARVIVEERFSLQRMLQSLQRVYNEETIERKPR
jgi:glycosyltransferase involved in cell wall biosynthesis